jgi:alpha-beta hydrolase superfamily lysophospholipase
MIIYYNRHIENKEVVLEDINNFILLTEKLYPSTVNKYIFGYSFGATLSMLTSSVRENYFNGMILLAPALKLNVAKYKYWLKLRMFAKLFPSLKLIPVKGNLLVIQKE